jgi:CrcB protein
MHWLAVAFGGMLGAMARFGLGRWLVAVLPSHVNTAIINVLGSILLGFVAGRMTGSDQGANHWQLFLMVGFCGSFTTFSSWIMDIQQLLEHTHVRAALGDLLLGVGVALAGLMIGLALGHSRLFRA